MLRDLINNLIPPEGSVLDVGCGNKQFSSLRKDTITVDAWEKLNPDYLINLEEEDLPFEENTFDTVLMIDFIEHISKDRGYELLEQAKRIAKNSVIVYTPLFWTDNKHNVNNKSCWAYGNEFDIHKSLWTEEDFKEWIRVGYIKMSLGTCWLGYYDCSKHTGD